MEPNSKRIAVTGGSGFIGGHVVAQLTQAGHTVLNIDKQGGDAIVADICDVDTIAGLLKESGAEYVFHIAGTADARNALENPVAAVQNNIGGTAAVLQAARNAGCGRVLLASTCWVANAMNEGVLNESAPFRPEGAGHVYTTTKIASELLTRDFCKLYGLPFTILRYGIPYGPGMWPGLVLMNFLSQAFSGLPLSIYGDGSAARRFVYVEDLARAHVLALQDIAENQVYNLEGMRFVSIRELAEMTSRLIGGVDIEYQEQPDRIGEFQHFRKLISSEKAFIELGWEPVIDLEEGVRRTIAWYKTLSDEGAPA
jgi:UDP-glucose 4-epimerase